MRTLSKIEDYLDEDQNRIHSESTYDGVQVAFRGKNNTLRIFPGAKVADLTINFDCDDGYCEIGTHDAVNIPFRGFIRVGLGSKVIIGQNVSCTGWCVVTAVEGASIEFGDDCMLASNNEVRSDDAHPIFDVSTEKRINPARSIKIGPHVWLAARAVVLGGTTIGRGSVVGHSSVVKGFFPNNCVVAGVPAKIIRKNIAWERPHLSLTKPWMKPDASSVNKSAYWEMTENDDSAFAPAVPLHTQQTT